MSVAKRFHAPIADRGRCSEHVGQILKRLRVPLQLPDPGPGHPGEAFACSGSDNLSFTCQEEAQLTEGACTELEHLMSVARVNDGRYFRCVGFGALVLKCGGRLMFASIQPSGPGLQLLVMSPPKICISHRLSSCSVGLRMLGVA